MNKKGDEKYYLLISFIIGLMIVAVILFWIFQEYFTQDELNLETCRQSIILRNNLPEIEIAKLTTQSLKDKFPLKCKTDVVDINYKNVTRAEKEVADAMAQCWYLMGNGAYAIFPAATWSTSSHCMICSRIHIDEKVKSFYAQPQNSISIKDSLNLRFGDKTYSNYLKTSGPQSALAWDFIWGDKFLVDNSDMAWIIDFSKGYSYAKLTFPEKIQVDQGDFFITISSVIYNKDLVINRLFFYQDNSGQSINQFNSKTVFKAGIWPAGASWKMCESFETVPA